MFFLEDAKENEGKQSSSAADIEPLHLFSMPLNVAERVTIGIWQSTVDKWHIGIIDQSTGNPYNEGIPFEDCRAIWNSCTFSKSSDAYSKADVVNLSGIPFREALVRSNPPQGVKALNVYQQIENLVHYQRALGTRPHW